MLLEKKKDKFSSDCKGAWVSMSTEQFGDMRTEYSKALVAVGEENPNVVVLGADTTDSLKDCKFWEKIS